MRTDESLESAIRENEAWEKTAPRTVALLNVGEAVTQSRIDGLKSSFSGHERNRLFISERGQAFRDLSGVSGLDSDKDGRVFVKWDFDRDGWMDIAVANNNRPLVNLYRNDLGSQGQTRPPGQFIAIRFVGGNRTAEPNTEYSARDGVGAKVTLAAGTLKLVREHHAGEGMASQNSATMLIGIDSNTQVDQISVRWPSGKTQQIQQVASGSLLTFYENPVETSEESGVEVTPYRLKNNQREWVETSPSNSTFTDLLKTLHPTQVNSQRTPLHVFTSMASWCPACKQALPQWEYLAEQLGPDVLTLNAVPIDPNDDEKKLADYVTQFQPAYQLLSATGVSERRAFQAALTEMLRRDVLPSTVVTDENYRILLVTQSAPTLSQLKTALMERSKPGAPPADSAE